MIDPAMKERIREILLDDIGYADVTTEALVSSEVKAKAEIIAKQGGTLAGINEAITVFEEMKVHVRPLKKDGQRIKPGEVIMLLQGPARGILAGERVALNLLMHMSGVATATREMIDIVRRENPKVVVAATRKSAPLLTYFDKRAVRVAGGEPHRYRLEDQILIKDNHLKLVGSVSKAIRKARQAGVPKKIEVEISKLQDICKAVRAGADIVMLDNMKPAEVKLAIKALEKEGLRDKIIIEASGGIDPSNIGSYAATGVDVISSSYMTLRAPALDMSLEVR